jgi:hypothetical protein
MDKHHWPPNSPDLSPLDFFYWNEAKKFEYNTFYENRCIQRGNKESM